MVASSFNQSNCSAFSGETWYIWSKNIRQIAIRRGNLIKPLEGPQKSISSPSIRVCENWLLPTVKSTYEPGVDQAKDSYLAVVVAQLVERSPPTPEIRGSNPVIGKLLSNISLLSIVLKDENKKEAGNGPNFIRIEEQ